MSRFSERLKNIVDDTGITQYMLAKNSGVDRPTVCRILSGSRTPSRENFDKLCHALSLPGEVIEELRDLMEMDADGEQLFRQRRAIISLIEGLSEHEPQDPCSGGSRTVILPDYLAGQETFVSTSFLSTNSLIRDILEYEFYNNSRTTVDVFCPFEYEPLFGLLLNLCADNMDERISVRHLIAFDSLSAASGTRNIEILRMMLPFALGSARCYHVSNFHTMLRDTERFHTPYQFFVIVNDTLILIEHGFSSAIMLRQPEVVEQYKNRFGSYYEQATPFSTIFPSAVDILGYVDGADNRKSFTLIMNTPACCMALDGQQIIAHRRREVPGIDQIAAAFAQRYDEIHSGVPEHQTSQLFTLDGIDEFIETGYSPEFPRELVVPFSMETRLRFVETYRDLIADGAPFYALRTDLIRFPKKSLLMVNDTNVMLSVYATNTYLNTITVTEESVLSAIKEFSGYMADSRFVMDREELVRQLDMRVDKLKKIMDNN